MGQGISHNVPLEVAGKSKSRIIPAVNSKVPCYSVSRDITLPVEHIRNGLLILGEAKTYQAGFQAKLLTMFVSHRNPCPKASFMLPILAVTQASMECRNS